MSVTARGDKLCERDLICHKVDDLLVCKCRAFFFCRTGPIKVLLTKFTSVFGQSLSHSIALGAFGGPSKLTQLAAYAPSLLNAPVGYTDVNTHPSWTQPIALHIFTGEQRDLLLYVA